MALTKEKISEIIKTYGATEKDSGCTEVQIALLTEKINILSAHMQSNKHDMHNKKGLLNFIAKRKKHLKYLQNNDFERYKVIISKLGIRK